MDQHSHTLIDEEELGTEKVDEVLEPHAINQGACRACDCRGYRDTGIIVTSWICKCGHHNRMHNGD